MLRRWMLASLLLLWSVGAIAQSSNTWNPGGVPQVNWANPLTQGLAFLWVPIGGMEYEFVGSVPGTRTGVVEQPGPYGLEISVTTANTLKFSSIPRFLTDNGVGTGGFTYFSLTLIPASASLIGEPIAVGGGASGNDADLLANYNGTAVASGILSIWLGVGPKYAATTGTVIDGKWHMLVATVPGDISLAKIYVDGISKAVTTSGTTYLTIVASSLFLGCDGGAGNGVPGTLQSISGGFNRVLSQAEVTSLTQNPFQLLSWPMDLPSQ